MVTFGMIDNLLFGDNDLLVSNLICKKSVSFAKFWAASVSLLTGWLLFVQSLVIRLIIFQFSSGQRVETTFRLLFFVQKWGFHDWRTVMWWWFHVCVEVWVPLRCHFSNGRVSEGSGCKLLIIIQGEFDFEVIAGTNVKSVSSKNLMILRKELFFFECPYWVLRSWTNTFFQILQPVWI